MVAEKEVESHKISVVRVRIGIVFFILWWLPVYLTVPTIAALFGEQDNHQAIVTITIIIITVQTVIGIIGVLLLGKELTHILVKVRYRKLPITLWRIIITGDTDVDPSFLKKPKVKKEKSES